MSQTENETLVTHGQRRYFASEECTAARHELEDLVKNPAYNIKTDRYTENASEFVERHLQYLSRHPLVKHEGYVSNLKLMTRVKRA